MMKVPISFWVTLAIGLLVAGTLAGRLTGRGIGNAIVAHSDYNLEQCMSTYAVPARSELGGRAAAAACYKLQDGASKPGDREWANCVLEDVARAGNETGAKLALAECNSRQVSAVVVAPDVELDPFDQFDQPAGDNATVDPFDPRPVTTAVTIPPPPPGFVLEQPAVIDTTLTDQIQRDRAQTIQARRDAEVVADEVAAAERRRDAAAPTDY